MKMYLAGAGLLLLTAARMVWAQDSNPQQESAPKFEPAVAADGTPISPAGQPRGQDLTDQPARYYVWNDADGWHLRSTHRKGYLGTFTGTVTIEGGGFTKLRAVGLEKKGRAADRWEGSSDRTRITFEIKTSNSFDGFDFDVDTKDAALLFDLKINGKLMPRRVFIGRNRVNPTKATFRLSNS